jgi:multiple sugar transport system permease protein
VLVRRLVATAPPRRTQKRPKGRDWSLWLLGVGPWQRAAVTAVMAIFFVLFVLPLYWLIVGATKDNAAIYNSFGLWFHSPFRFVQNLRDLFGYQNGIFLVWVRNTLIYSVAGGGGAAFVAAAAGYAFARYDFPWKRWAFAAILGSMLVPYTALTIPEFIFYSKLHLTNNMLGMVIPSLVSPLGVYLMWVYIDGFVPREMLEAARLDGAGEWRTLGQIAFPLMAPGFVTVLLFTMVASWNNYFLPYILFSKESLYPLTVGLTNMWGQTTAGASGTEALQPLIVVGGLVSLVPVVALFLGLQRYWKSGLLVGALNG